VQGTRLAAALAAIFRWKPCLAHQFGKLKRRSRGVLCRFHHDGITNSEARRKGVGHQIKWRIPRNNHRHHANGFAHREVKDIAFINRDGFTMNLVRQSGVIVIAVRHHAHLGAHLLDQFAIIPCFNFSKTLGMFTN